MTNDPFRTAPGTNPPRHVRHSSKAPFIWGAIVIAILLIIGAWAVHNRSAGHRPDLPAVTAAPAATTPPQHSEETTGQAPPRAQ
jgi:hypothetical protein